MTSPKSRASSSTKPSMTARARAAPAALASPRSTATASLFQTYAGLQVLIDLVIVSILALFWIRVDSRKHGRKSRPWVAIMLAAGSFGPLLYLLLAHRGKGPCVRSKVVFPVW